MQKEKLLNGGQINSHAATTIQLAKQLLLQQLPLQAYQALQEKPVTLTEEAKRKLRLLDTWSKLLIWWGGREEFEFSYCATSRGGCHKGLTFLAQTPETKISDTPVAIRTRDLQLRRLTLYPAELRVQSPIKIHQAPRAVNSRFPRQT